MSGGRFDYKQYEITRIADEIQNVIDNNNLKIETKDSWESEYYSQYPDDIIDHFKVAVMVLRQAHVYAQRVDWLLSGDDGEDSFRSRLQNDLFNLK